MGPVNSAQCLLYSVIRVHKQYKLLLISLNAYEQYKSHQKNKKRKHEIIRVQTTPYSLKKKYYNSAAKSNIFDQTQTQTHIYIPTFLL